jgi:hypothetical protein
VSPPQPPKRRAVAVNLDARAYALFGIIDEPFSNFWGRAGVRNQGTNLFWRRHFTMKPDENNLGAFTTCRSCRT